MVRFLFILLTILAERGMIITRSSTFCGCLPRAHGPVECSILIRFQATTIILKITMTFERNLERNGHEKGINNGLNKNS